MNFIVLIPAIFIVYTSILACIDLYPFNDIGQGTPDERRATLTGNCFYAGIVVYSWFALPGYLWVNFILSFLLLVVYSMVSGIPYFFGHFSDVMQEQYERLYGETIKILPPIKDHPIPDLANMINGLFVIAWFMAVVCKLLG